MGDCALRGRLGERSSDERFEGYGRLPPRAVAGAPFNPNLPKSGPSPEQRVAAGLNQRWCRMSNTDRIRDRAIRLLALALKAREDGRSEYFDRLTELAMDAFTHAEEMERLGSSQAADTSASGTSPQIYEG